jgi:hypothetical protein
MHNFGFCDAAEVFVMLAGMSSMLAYGKIFHRDGIKPGLRKIAGRCGRIYLFQISLLLTTIGVVLVCSNIYHLEPRSIAPILGAPVKGLAHGLWTCPERILRFQGWHWGIADSEKHRSSFPEHSFIADERRGIRRQAG